MIFFRRLQGIPFLVLLLEDAREDVAAPAHGYDLQIVEAGKVPDFAPPTLQTGVVNSIIIPFAPGPDGTLYTLAIRARKGEVSGDAAVIALHLVASGGGLAGRPNSPTNLQARALPDGDVEVRWDHDGIGATVEATAFQVFAGVGEVDYAAPLATVGQYDTLAVLSGLAPGTQQLIAVRAFSAAGAHDGGAANVMVVPRDAAPSALLSFEITQV